MRGGDAEYPPELVEALVALSKVATTLDPGRGEIVVERSADATGGAKEQARYQALVEQIPALTFTVDLEHGAPDIYIGPQIEEILGFSQREWMSNPILWFQQCHPEDREVWNREFARGIETGGPFRADCRVYARDGKLVWLHGEARLVRDEHGRPMFIQGIAFDITEQKLAEQRMREAEEIKVMNERLAAVGQMAASIGHDLRNPLGAIGNAWHYIRKKMDDGTLATDKRAPRMCEIIDRELRRSATIISELLQYSRDREPYREPCPLGPLVDEAASVVRKPAKTMKIVNEVPDDLPVPNLDVDLIRQCIVNLMQNAVEAIPPTGHVWVRAHAGESDDVVLEIADDGRGIATELHENVWKPLFTTKVRGTGLGLPIVANVVQRHGGLVSLHSTPGRGATFRLGLPIGRPSEGPAPMAGGAAEGDLLGPEAD